MSESANLNPDLTSVSWVHEDEKMAEDKTAEEEKTEDKKPKEDNAVEDKNGGDGLPEPALSTREI